MRRAIYRQTPGTEDYAAFVAIVTDAVEVNRTVREGFIDIEYEHPSFTDVPFPRTFVWDENCYLEIDPATGKRPLR